MILRRMRFSSYPIHQLVNPVLDRTYFIVTYKACTTNFIQVSHMRSIVFSFNKNSFRTPSDNTRHEISHSFLISNECFKFHISMYTLYYTHLHTNMMFMQCLSKRLYNVTSSNLGDINKIGRLIMLRSWPVIQHQVSVCQMTLAWRASPILALAQSFRLRDRSTNTPPSGLAPTSRPSRGSSSVPR